MTEPQVWTLMTLMAAVFFGTMTIISTMFMRVVRSEIGSLRHEMNARFATVDARFDVVDVRLDAVNAHIDNLDRGVQVLMNREINRDN